MRRALVVLLVVMSGFAASGASHTQAVGPGPVDPRLFVIGDSVIVGARATLAQSLPGWQVNVFSEEGFSTLAAPAVINGSRPLIGEVVVVGLGNNDAGNPATFGQRIDAVMRSLPGVQRVIWVNLRRFRDFVPALDAQLTAATARWPNLDIADWDARATPDPSLVYADGLHLTPAGEAAMSTLISQHLDAYVRSRIAASTTTTVTTLPPATTRPSAPPHAPRHRDDPGLGGPVAGAIGIGIGVLIAVGLTVRAVRRRRARRVPWTAP